MDQSSYRVKLERIAPFIGEGLSENIFFAPQYGQGTYSSSPSYKTFLLSPSFLNPAPFSETIVSRISFLHFKQFTSLSLLKGVDYGK